MTTNLPQDVAEDFKEAGFPVELMFDWEGRLAKFLQLRDQRQQGSEPVAVVRGVGDKKVTVQWLHGFPSIGERLYRSTPPQANAEAALREVMHKGIRVTIEKMATMDSINDEDINAIVNSVLGEGGK